MSAAQQLVTQIGVVAGIQVMVTVQASATAAWDRWPRSTGPIWWGVVVALAATVCAVVMQEHAPGRDDRPRRRPPAQLSTTRSWPGCGPPPRRGRDRSARLQGHQLGDVALRP